MTGCSYTSTPVTSPQSETACKGNQAMIGVGDGYLENLCGCGGTQGQVVAPPQTFTCTTSGPNVVVYFNYLATQTPHQIASTGTGLTFNSSPLSDPRATNPIRVHAAQLNASGTYTFVDLFNSSIQGTIIVP